MARYDQMGLIWMRRGERVVALTAIGARLSGGLTFYQKALIELSLISRPSRAQNMKALLA
jgi:hypothetical protein